MERGSRSKSNRNSIVDTCIVDFYITVMYYTTWGGIWRNQLRLLSSWRWLCLWGENCVGDKGFCGIERKKLIGNRRDANFLSSCVIPQPYCLLG